MSSSTPEEKELSKKAEVTPTTIETSTSSNKDFLEAGNKISANIKELIDAIGKFWVAYKLPVLLGGIVLVIAIFLKLSLALLDAINHLPLIRPTLESIGIIYTCWFVWRYLRNSSQREELAEAIASVRQSFSKQNNQQN